MAGNTNSKEVREEIVIAQSGNSGGQTNSPQQNGSISSRDILETGVIIVAVAVIILYLYGRCKKKFEKKIRREITASQELV